MTIISLQDHVIRGGKGGTADNSDERLGMRSFSDARLECTPCPEIGNAEVVAMTLLDSKAVASLTRPIRGDPWVNRSHYCCSVTVCLQLFSPLMTPCAECEHGVVVACWP